MTIRKMAAYIREDAGSAEILATLQAAAGKYRTPAGLLSNLHEWIRRHVRFVTDPRNAQAAGFWRPEEVELLIRPRDLVRMTDPSGDCDDFSQLTAALLIAAGIPCELVTIAANPEDPDAWSHVYVLAYTDQGPVAMDTSHGRYPGWEYPAPFRKAVWPVGGKVKQLGGDVNLVNPDGFGFGINPTVIPEMPTAGIPWGTIITNASNTAGNILSARFGQPPAGTFRQTGPNGEVYFRQQTGDSTIPFFPSSSAGSGSSLLLIGLAAVLLVVLTKNN